MNNYLKNTIICILIGLVIGSFYSIYKLKGKIRKLETEKIESEWISKEHIDYYISKIKYNNELYYIIYGPSINEIIIIPEKEINKNENSK